MFKTSIFNYWSTKIGEPMEKELVSLRIEHLCNIEFLFLSLQLSKIECSPFQNEKPSRKITRGFNTHNKKHIVSPMSSFGTIQRKG